MGNKRIKPILYNSKRFRTFPTDLIKYAKSQYVDVIELTNLLTKDGKGTLIYSPATVENKLNQLHQVLDEAEDIDRNPLTREHLDDLMITNEVVWSGRVESEPSKKSDVEAVVSKNKHSEDGRIIRHNDAISYVKNNSSRPITKDDVSKLFMILSDNGKRVDAEWVGEFDIENKTGFRKKEIVINNSNGFTPTLIDSTMDGFIKFFNDDTIIDDPNIKAIIIHYYFESIHPFSDYNGRVGRILVNWYYNNINSSDKIYFSLICELNTDLYYRAFRKSYQQGGGDVTYFIHTLLTMYILEKNAYIMLEKIKRHLITAQKTILSDNCSDILMFYLSKKDYDSQKYKTSDLLKLFLGESEVSVRKWIANLVNLGIIETLNGSRENQYVLTDHIKNLLAIK